MDPELFVIVNSERWWRHRSTSRSMATVVALHQDHRLAPRWDGFRVYIGPHEGPDGMTGARIR